MSSRIKLILLIVIGLAAIVGGTTWLLVKTGRIGGSADMVVGDWQQRLGTSWVIKQTNSKVSAFVDKTQYAPAENVVFGLKNDSTKTVKLVGTTYWRIVDMSRQTVYIPTGATFNKVSSLKSFLRLSKNTMPAWQTVTLKPGEKKTWTWDQKSLRQGLVPSGYYWVEFPFLRTAARFTIQKEGETFVSLKTTASSYKVGEAVWFILTNNSAANIILRNSNPWQINDAKGQAIYTPISTQMITMLAPGQSKKWSWQQVDNSNNQVAEGTYSVEISELKTKAAFDIGTVSQPVMLNMSAGTYKAGQNVEFSVKNASTEAVVLRNTAPWRITDDKDGVIYSPISTQVQTTLAAGEERKWTWDQKGDNGRQAWTGNYKVALLDFPTVSANFKIEADVTPFVGSENYLPWTGNVEFGIRNTGGKDVTLTNTNPWRITDRYGNIVYTPASQPTTTTLKPGEQTSWNWNKKNSAGKSVATGQYWVEFTDFPGVRVALTISLGQCGTDGQRCPVWGVGY